MPAHEVTSLVFFGGGVDTTKDPIAIEEESQLIATENFVPEGQGLTVRPGVISFIGSGPANDRYNFLDVAEFKTTRALVVANKNNVYATETQSLTQIGTITNTDTVYNSMWSGASVANTYFLATPKDEVKTWTGTISTGQLVDLKDVSGYVGPASLKARFVAGFAGRPILGYVTDADGTNPHRVRWAQRTTLTVGSGWKNWTGTGAGAVDLDEYPGHITGMTVFNGILVIFKSECIVFGFETGDANNPIRFQKGGSVGCINGRTFAPISHDTGIFLSKNGFYMLTAGGVTPLGDEVRRYLFGPSTEQTTGRVANLNTTKQRLACAWTEPITGAYWCSLVLSGADYPNLGLSFEPSSGKWTAHYFNTPVCAVTNKSYGIVDGTIYPTKTRPIVASYASLGFVGLFDPDENYDGGATAITAYFKTKDLRFNPAGAATLYAIHVHMTLTGSTAPNVTGTLTVEIDGDRQEDSSKLSIAKAFTFSSSVRSQTLTIPVHYSAEGYRQHQTAIFHRFKFNFAQSVSSTGVSLSIPAVEFEWLPRWNIQYPTTA